MKIDFELILHYLLFYVCGFLLVDVFERGHASLLAYTFGYIVGYLFLKLIEIIYEKTKN